MHITNEQLTPTKRKLTIVAEPNELDTVKEHVLKQLSSTVKVQGFRQGKAPAALIEKQVDQAALQSEFLDHAVNDLYVQAIDQERLRPAAQPEIAISKFVPFTTLEFTAEVEAVGEIKLADYKKIKLAAKKPEVTAKDVTEVVENLRTRAAEKQEVKRAAKDGDEVIIDFTGVDAKTNEPISGADGTDYPLQLGSKTFIPGFEEQLVGLKGGEEKVFDITFPADYGSPELQNKPVTFTVTVKQVNDLVKPKADDDFAASVGPFKTMTELKADIKKQVTAEREQEAQREYDNELLEKIADKSSVEIPDSLVHDEMKRMEDEEKRNIAYRGQTWQEHLDQEGLTAEEHLEKQRPGAELRVKVGLLLGEIAEAEKITVSPEDLEVRIMLLKNQYPDEAMQTELDKPDNRRDIMSRMMTEKTIEKLREYGTSAPSAKSSK